MVAVAMLAISFIPSFTVGGVKIKRANILSDIFKFGDEVGGSDGEAELAVADQAFVDELDKIEQEMAAAAAAEGDSPADATDNDSWVLGEGFDDNFTPASAREDDGYDVGSGVLVPNAAELDAQDRFAGVTPFEDFTEDGRPKLADFCALLGTATKSRTVRLAFLGDSYIEGDILTADVRSQLQQSYGGGGVGFVPFSTPLAQNRPTIKHSSGGWTNYNLIHKKSAAANARERFFVSGIVSVPSGKAWVKYENTNFRARLSSVGTARLLFTNTGSSEITLKVNDTIVRTFTPAAGDEPQMINVTGVGIQTLRMEVSKPAGFYGYGLWLESGRGVGVDNYSIRSNSGLALSGTSAAINMQINKMVGYDLVVLQYGLNAMSADITRYTSYGQQIRRVINYIKTCFPNSVIVVMAVGDRSTLRGGEYVTMPGVRGMVAEQRAAAQDCGVVFWNTFAAMGGDGSMSRFVRNGWAAKDYTHLSFGGGRELAKEFVKALEYEKYKSAGAVSVEADDLQPSGYLGVGQSLSLDGMPAEDTAGGVTDSLPATEEDATVGGNGGDAAGDNTEEQRGANAEATDPDNEDITWRDLNELLDPEQPEEAPQTENEE